MRLSVSILPIASWVSAAILLPVKANESGVPEVVCGLIKKKRRASQ